MTHPGGRMPVFRSADPIRTHWLTALCLLDIFYGLVNVFGRSDGASQVLLRSLPPVPVWATLPIAASIVASVAIYLGYSVIGGIAGTLAWGSLVFASIASIATGTALSWSGPVLYGFVTWVHVLITYEVSSELDSERERRQRG